MIATWVRTGCLRSARCSPEQRPSADRNHERSFRPLKHVHWAMNVREDIRLALRSGLGYPAPGGAVRSRLARPARTGRHRPAMLEPRSSATFSPGRASGRIAGAPTARPTSEERRTLHERDAVQIRRQAQRGRGPPRLRRGGGAARHRHRAGAPSGTGWRRSIAISAPRNRRTARASATDSRRKIDAWHRARRRQPVEAAALRGVPARDRLSRAGAGRFRDRHRPMSTTRSPAIAGPQLVVPVLERPLRAQRRQRPLGQPLRRALRHRRDPGDGGAGRAGGYNPARGAAVVARARAVPRRGGAAGARGEPRRRGRLRGRRTARSR